MVVYATSNLRYILPQDPEENRKVILRDMEPQYSQQTEDRLALADRFGIWLSFYAPGMQDYLAKIKKELGTSSRISDAAEAFARRRALHNYRTAEQFIRQYRRGDLRRNRLREKG